MSAQENLIWNIIFAVACFAVGFSITHAITTAHGHGFVLLMTLLSAVPYFSAIRYTELAFYSWLDLKGEH